MMIIKSGISVDMSISTRILESRYSRFAIPKRSISCSSRVYALMTRAPVTFSCTTALTASSFFCTFENCGNALYTMSRTTTTINGREKRTT